MFLSITEGLSLEGGEEQERRGVAGMSSLISLPRLPLAIRPCMGCGSGPCDTGGGTQGSDPRLPFVVGSVVPGARVPICTRATTLCSTTSLPGLGACVWSTHRSDADFVRCLSRVPHNRFPWMQTGLLHMPFWPSAHGRHQPVLREPLRWALRGEAHHRSVGVRVRWGQQEAGAPRSGSTRGPS